MEKRRIIEQIPVENSKSGNNSIDVEVYYSKGGMSYFSGTSSPRGYYISVTPVHRKGIMVRTTMFTGVKKFLMSANRYTEKQFNNAVELGKQAAPDMLEKEQAA